MTIGTISNAENMGTVRGKLNEAIRIANSQYIHGSGRMYCFSDDLRWVTNGDDNYGTTYYQWSENGGAGADPIAEWEHKGDLVFPGQKVLGLTMVGDSNSTELEDIEVSLIYKRPTLSTAWESGFDNDAEMTTTELYRGFFWNNVDAGQPAFSGNTNDTHGRTFAITSGLQTIPELGFISIYLRPHQPTLTLTANRYFRMAYAWNVG